MSPKAGQEQAKKKSPDRATLRRAIKGLLRVLERRPNDLRSFVRLARAYRLLGETKDSAEWYRRAIDGYAAHDMGLRALALSKELISVDPSDHAVLLEMARLYARLPDRGRGRVAIPLEEPEDTAVGSIPREFTATSAKALVLLDDPAEVERVEPELMLEAARAGTKPRRIATPIPEDDDDEEATEIAMSGDAGAAPGEGLEPPPPPLEAFLVDEVDEEGDAGELATDPAWHADPSQEEETSPRDVASAAPREDAEAAARALPPTASVLQTARMGDLPLLSSLGETAFVTLSSAMRPLALSDGEILFRMGDAARSFFIVASGGIEARVNDEQVIATLGEGEVVGLFGLYTGRRRNATAVAAGSALVFEITDRTLAKLIREHPASKRPLALFYRQRLLEISLGRSPLFRDLPREKRLAIVARFEQRRFAAREAVIAPGQVTLGLHLVVRGKVIITTRDSGIATIEATMERGQFFGCISALTGMPTLASAECTEESILAVLPHRTFSELLRLQPELATLPRKLREERLLLTPTIFVGEPAGVRSGART